MSALPAFAPGEGQLIMVSGSRFLLRKRLGVAPDILIQMLANIRLSRDLLNLGSFKLINEMARDSVARDLGAVDDLDPGKLWPSHLPDNCQQWWGTPGRWQHPLRPALAQLSRISCGTIVL